MADVDELADGLLQVDWCHDFERLIIHVVLCDSIEVGIEYAGRTLVGEDIGVGHGKVTGEPFVMLLSRVVVVNKGHHVAGWQGKTCVVANHARMGQLRHVELVARLIAHIGERELQGKVEGMDVGTALGYAVNPFLDIPPVSSPILADDERLLAAVQGQTLHPTADELRLQAAHEVETETVEAYSF